MTSIYLQNKKPLMKRLINEFNDFDYVSILGNDIKGKTYQVSTRQTAVNESMYERGFVVKLYKNKLYREYSFDNLTEENFKEIVNNIRALNDIKVEYTAADTSILNDEPLVKDFKREREGKNFSDEEILNNLKSAKDLMMAEDNIVNAMARFEDYEVSKCFISRNRELAQSYSYFFVVAMAVSRNETNMQNSMQCKDGINPELLFKELEGVAKKASSVAKMLLNAKPVKPGVYEVITHPSITGLIAHEAFGHGVEMDMFVKNRAMAPHYINKQVASPLVNMHDGAAADLNIASYFFDDDGVLAHDTVIIDKGTLITGISDSLSASVLKTVPTGNGRRQSFDHKAYTRMTNTFFMPGKDKKEDMIKSIKHGYILYDTSNGMEDPKNWGIQCTAAYGLEIKDGKLTGEVIAPVIMSGYVPDLLKSISMVSDDFELCGLGFCGKGHKEWVRVSDGGPYLKAEVKLG